jgi:hypothetical protein
MVGAVSEEKCAVILWLRRCSWHDVCPRERRRLPTNPNRAPTPAQPNTPTIANPTVARPPTPYAISTATPGVQNTLRSPAATPPPTRYPTLPTSRLLHRGLYRRIYASIVPPQGRQSEPMNVPRNHDLVEV